MIILEKSDTIKQIIICIIIIVLCGLGAFLVKEHFFENKNKTITSQQVKDKYEYNEYTLVNVTTEMLIQRYLVDFKDMILHSKEEAYQLLDKDAKNKYPTYSEFKEFIEENIDKLSTSMVSKYATIKKDSSTKYIILDQYGYKYTFTTSAVLVYKVNLELPNETASIFE